MAIDPAIFVNGVGFKNFFLNYKGVPSGFSHDAEEAFTTRKLLLFPRQFP
ncbi:hypothetical protein HanHA300_Chr10g0371801 [Helianthus annuus]|nr:hypothetical protein HanHA300_Chr10g0371801 [Helianthus annuus]